MEIYVLRHCKTENNIKNSWCGAATDNDLSEEGALRNKELIEELSKLKFDCIYTSPLKRCLATAKPLSEKLNCKLIIDERLKERNFGSIEGQPCDQNDKMKLADLKLNTDLGKGVERVVDILDKRVSPFYNELRKKSHERVLVVTHSWIIRLLKYIFSNREDASVISITPPNGMYFKHEDKNIISRAFNSIKVKGDKITKTSSYVSKFNNEIMWMVNLPKEMKEYIPEITSYKVVENPSENNFSFIEMKYIKAGSFDQKYLKDILSGEEIDLFFKRINNFLNGARKFKMPHQNCEQTIKELRDIYLDKTIQRWNEIKDSEKFRSFYNNDIYINGKKYYSVKYYLDNLEKTLKENGILEYRDFCIIHGDLCFNNILIDDNKMYLIDPRGSFGKVGLYGDQYYEIAKLVHSIDGYDCIINDLFNIEYNTKKNNINYNFTNTNNKKQFKRSIEKQYSTDEIKKIYLIESLLFLSMIPLHSEDYEHQLVMLAFAVELLSNYIK